MPTIFSHAIFAVLLGKTGVKKSVSVWFWILTSICAIVPDADVVTRSFGAERGSLFSHRGFTHSIFFAIVFGALIAFFAGKFLKINVSFFKMLVFFALATFTHPFLDMLTNGGSGVALFAPFSNERFFFPWHPVEVSPIGFGFFSHRGVTVILSEIMWIWLPGFLIFGASEFVRRAMKKR